MKRKKLIGRGLLVLVLVELFVLLFYIGSTKLVPGMHLVLCGEILAIVAVLVMAFIRKIPDKVCLISGIILVFVVTLGGFVGIFSINKANTLYENIASEKVEMTHIGVYTKGDSTVSSLTELSSGRFGILAQLDRGNTDRAVEKAGQENGMAISCTEYPGLIELVDAVQKGEIQAMLLNQVYLDVLSEMDGYANIRELLKEITVIEVEDVKEETTATGNAGSTAKADDAVEMTVDNGGTSSFCVYISGIDSREGMVAKSLSDVNIIATINPKTKQVLLVSTPRDYYVPLSISGGVPDKLTHAGIYGVDVCRDTLAMLYDIDVDYYFRINFGGFVDIIDALGGITVVSDYEFDSQNILGYHFVQGENLMSGEEALVFARERFAFSEGDRQRGKNQMAVIKGVVNKVLSADLLKNFSALLKEVEGSFEMNIPYDVLASLVRSQLSEGGQWQILSYSVDGSGSSQKPYSMSMNTYVMIPDQVTVEKAQNLMAKVRNGEVINPEEL